jgi:hypothetical protein
MALPITPISIQPSSDEISSGTLSQKNLEIATRALHRDGLVVLEVLIPHGILDKLNRKMVEDAYELQSRKDSPFNYHKGNIQQDPLLTEEYFFEEVFVRELTVPLTPPNSWLDLYLDVVLFVCNCSFRGVLGHLPYGPTLRNKQVQSSVTILPGMH